MGKESNEEPLKNQLAVENSIAMQIKALSMQMNTLSATVKQLKDKVDGLETSDKGYHRKNRRVCYIPKKPLVEKVLDALRKNDTEPLKETILKVFAAAAKNLGLSDRDES
jgi:hypothetical protein